MRKSIVTVLALSLLPMAVVEAKPAVSPDYVVSPGKPEHPLQVKVVSAAESRAGAETEAKLLVSSARDIEAMEVRVEPAPGMVLYDARFERSREDLVRGEAELPLRFRPAADGSQVVLVHLRATGSDGRVISRTVKVSLDQPGVAGGKVPRNIRVPKQLPEPAGDAVNKAEQEVVRH